MNCSYTVAPVCVNAAYTMFGSSRTAGHHLAADYLAVLRSNVRGTPYSRVGKSEFGQSFLSFEDIRTLHEGLGEGTTSSEDKSSESSQTELPEPVERDTEELVLKRGFVSVG